MSYEIDQLPDWLRVIVGILVLASPLILAAYVAGVALGRRGWTEAVERHVVWHGDEKDAVISYRGSPPVVERAGNGRAG